MEIRFLPPWYAIAVPEQPSEQQLLASLPFTYRSDRHHGWVMYWTHIIGLPRPMRISDDDKVAFRALNAFATDCSHLKEPPRSPVPLAPEYRPRDYQLRGAYALFQQKRAVLADDMGLGKTLQAVLALAHAALLSAERPTLVLCPAPLRWQWRSELARMLRRPDDPGEPLLGPEAVRVIDGGGVRRRTQWGCAPAAVTICGYESARRDQHYLLKHYAVVPLAAMICDESSKFKNPDGSLFTSMVEIRRVLRPEYRFMLNATPIENGLGDLWAQMAIVEPVVFPNREAFELRHYEWKTGVSKKTGRPYRLLAGYKHVDEVKSRVRDRFLRRTCYDVAQELPDIVFMRRTVVADEVQRSAILSAEEASKRRSKGDVVTGRTAEMVAALYCEAADGTVHSAKLDALSDLLDEIGDDQVVMIADSLRFCELLRTALQTRLDAGVQNELPLESSGVRRGLGVGVIHSGVKDDDREALMREFRAGSCRYMIGTSAIERGLNLQSANWLINFDLPWNPARVQQRIGRIRRLGSRHGLVRVVNMVLEQSIDHRILERIYEKQNLFAAMFTVGAQFDAGADERQWLAVLD